MLVMPGANGNILLGYLAGRFPGQVGTMVSTATGWMKPHEFLPYSVDNGIYADTLANRPWNEAGFLKLLDKAGESEYPPLWVVVPDAMYDRDQTLKNFDLWAPRIERMGFRLAIACQDGMSPSDVPEGVVAFIGGSDAFKTEAKKFVDAGHVTHFGRINNLERLKAIHEMGITSCDSTGWFRQGGVEHRKPKEKWRISPLLRYLEWTNAKRYKDPFYDLVKNGVDAVHADLVDLF